MLQNDWNCHISLTSGRNQTTELAIGEVAFLAGLDVKVGRVDILLSSAAHFFAHSWQGRKRQVPAQHSLDGLHVASFLHRFHVQIEASVE